MAFGLDVSRSMRVVADLDFSTDLAIGILKAVETFSKYLFQSILSSVSIKCTPVRNK